MTKLTFEDVLWMYEQKRKDINKAQTDAVIKIANVLGCEIEEILD